MTDPFVLLTPALVLAVMALLRFIGCNAVLGLHDTTLAPSRPIIDRINPSFATQGSPGFALTVTGSNFVANSSVVQWNGEDRPTAFFPALNWPRRSPPLISRLPGRLK